MPVMTGTALNNISYEDLVRWTRLSSGHNEYLDKYIVEAAKYGVGEMEAVEDMASTYMNFYKDGNGKYTITSFNSDAQISSINPVDSNIGKISRGNVQTPLNRAKDAVTNKLNLSTTPASGSFAQNAAYFLGSVGQAVGCASAGITLGKKIDGALYNANPDFWNSIGLSSLNPETWNSITNGDDSLQAGLFNFIFGIDPDTGNGQLYMDETAFAYMAYALSQQGIFDTGETEIIIDSGTTIPNFEIINYAPTLLSVPITFTGRGTYQSTSVPEHIASLYIESANSDVYLIGRSIGDVSDRGCKIEYCLFSKESFTFYNDLNDANQNNPQYYHNTATQETYNDDVFYVGKPYFYNSNWMRSTILPAAQVPVSSSGYGSMYSPDATTDSFPRKEYIWALLFNSDIHTSGGIEGITNQEGATSPNISDWDTIPDTLSSLQNQYPDLWNNPLVWDNYQPDGTNPQKVYIPVATPNSLAGTNTQPTSSDSTQTNPQISPATSTQSLIDFLTNVMTQPNPQTNPLTQEETDTQPKIPPQNPVDVGTGTSSPIVPPVGSASALWSVYHPTQAQVNSFGAWLWTDNIITQIQQVLQNPMEGIITLHKVFATPVDAGTGTIVVGRLDSQVPSATVTEQYVTVDCGSVDCHEQFGNVFDYDPFTKISLYLPFIGIVPLNIDDVMRSTINVVYGVDVFTGACLAMVNVSRDSNTINMYQYAGMASVEYPLTGSVHGGLITGLLGLASGAVGAALASTGVGAIAGAATMAGGLSSAAKANNARSGGFSGNSGAMGIKIPYLIIERPQTKVAETFPRIEGYPTNYSSRLGDLSGQVNVKSVHVEGINATDVELKEIESLLKSGVLV